MEIYEYNGGKYATKNSVHVRYINDVPTEYVMQVAIDLIKYVEEYFGYNIIDYYFWDGKSLHIDLEYSENKEKFIKVICECIRGFHFSISDTGRIIIEIPTTYNCKEHYTIKKIPIPRNIKIKHWCNNHEKLVYATIIIALILGSLILISLSNHIRYMRCEVYVCGSEKTYHIYETCDRLDNCNSVLKVKLHDLDNRYRLCKDCEEWYEFEQEVKEYESESYDNTDIRHMP